MSNLAIQNLSSQSLPTCADTTAAYLFETASTLIGQAREQGSKAFEKVVQFGDHYYQQLPTSAQMGGYKDAFLNTTSAGYESAKTFAGEKFASASAKMGEFSETIASYGPTAREKLVQAGEYVRASLPDLNDPQTLEVIAQGVVITSFALMTFLMFREMYKIQKQIEKEYQRFDSYPIVVRQCDDQICTTTTHWSHDYTLFTAKERAEMNRFFWDMQTAFDEMFADLRNALVITF